MRPPHPTSGIDVDLREIVDRIDKHTADPQEVGFRNAGCPGFAVVVAPYNRQRRDRSQRFEDANIADVPAMHDEVAPLQRCHSLGAQQPVRV